MQYHHGNDVTNGSEHEEDRRQVLHQRSGELSLGVVVQRRVVVVSMVTVVRVTRVWRISFV